MLARMHAVLGWPMIAAALLLGCGGSRGGGSLIGATCKHSEQCGPAGVCITSGKDGLCSLPCVVPGGPNECLPGSYCDEELVQTDTQDQADLTLCFPACTDKSQCRAGYDCKPINGGPGKVCRAK
jgi:hypothetical protein